MTFSPLGFAYDDYDAEVRKLKAERDELLEAAKEVCRCHFDVPRKIEKGSLATHDHALMALGEAVKKAEGRS